MNDKQLIEYGFKRTNNPNIPFEKDLDEDYDGEICLIVTRERNVTKIALRVNSDVIFLNIKTLKQLKKFESFIEIYSPSC
jgi:hypothetical protein